MRISKWTALWLVWLTVIPLSAKPVIHRAAADVRLASDYISTTQILDITPQDADEFRIPVEGKVTEPRVLNTCEMTLPASIRAIRRA